MKNFDLENFPTSESALKMLSYVSEGFYDKSYVGKWLYQVMGIEYDDALQIAEELPDQFFPETATWGLMYHEIKWGLPVRDNLPYEERRRLIYLKRDYRAPMTPHRMETYLEDATGFEVHIADSNDPGEYGFAAPHPNAFKAYFLGEGTLDSKKVHEILDRLKQSHTAYKVNDRIETVVDESEEEQIILRNIRFKAGIPFWYEYVYDGSWLLDGSVMLSELRRYDLALSIKKRLRIRNDTEDLRLHSLSAGWRQHVEERIKAGAVYSFSADFWRLLYLNGYGLLNGEHYLSQNRCRSKVCLIMHIGIASEGREEIANVAIETKTRDYWFLDGALSLNGTRSLNSIYRKEVIE